MKRALAVAAVAVLGIVIAAAITFAASRLTSQHIGLADEPLTAGERLAEPEATRVAPTPAATRTPRPRRTPVPAGTPAPVRTAVPTVADDGRGRGRGRGRNRGRGGDDD